MKTVGVPEGDRREVLADIFGRQIGNTKEEGILDSDTEEEYWLRLSQLKDEWKKRMGTKGSDLHSWIWQYKADEMAKSMLRSVRVNNNTTQHNTTLIFL